MWHKTLLRRLPSYRLSGNFACGWSFLADKSIKVVVDGARLDPKCVNVNSSVPQGCLLSLTQFLMHINDKLQEAYIHCYADDTMGDA